MGNVKAAIADIEYYLPETVLTNEHLATAFPEWPAEKIESKLGIRERRIAGPEECASDMGVAAAQALFAKSRLQPADVDFVLFCTQSPDYFLPTTACIVQQRLGIPQTAGALDFNLGCSGFVYGLGLAKGLVETGQAKTVLLITAETYSKFIHPEDKSVRTVFGDGAAATIVRAVESDAAYIGPIVYGTDGRGANNLIVPTGGARRATETNPDLIGDEGGSRRTINSLYMNGAEIFDFTLKIVPVCVGTLLQRAGTSLEAIDLFVFHQANRFVLDHLRKKMRIPTERFYVSMSCSGNTVSSTIPIALKNAHSDGRLVPGMTVALVGFGVGYSWAAAIVRWTY
jgi:3-oxoacyl-[acyl-carrier-protein] synthase III